LKNQDFPWQNELVAKISRGTAFLSAFQGLIKTKTSIPGAVTRRFALAVFALTVFSVTVSASWLATGPFGGDADIVRAIPGTKGHVIAAARNGLVFSSTNGGASWVNTPFPAQFAGVLHALEVDPKSTATWYAGVESEIGRVSGVYKTTDNGAHWTQLPGTAGIGVWSLALWPGDDAVIAAGTSSGVFLSRDAGVNWKKISAADNTELQPVVSLAFHPTDSKILYAGTTHLPWKTANGGATWQSIHTGMLDDSDVFSIVVDPKQPEHVMASACSGVYNSLDGAAHWTKLDTPTGAFRTHFVALDPRHEGVVFAGTTDGLLKSVNGGHAWRKVSAYSIRSLAWDSGLDGRVFFAATSGTATPGSLLVSNDEGSTLRESDTGFTNRNFTTLTGSGLELYSSSVYEAGTGGAYRTGNFAARWEHAGGPAGDELVRMATAPDDPKRLYAAGYHGLFESRDGGLHWLARKMPSESPVVALMPLARGELLAGTASGMFRANETGAWTSVTGVPIQSIQRSSENVVAALTGTGGLVSRDAGMTWKSCGDAGPKGPWNGLAFDMVGGSSQPLALAATATGLFRSADGCQTWSQVHTGLDNATVSLVLFHPTRAGEAFISQGGHIFVSNDGGQRWQPIDDETDGSTGGNAGGFGGPASLVVLSAAPDTLFALFPRRGVYTTGIGFWTASLPVKAATAEQTTGKTSAVNNTGIASRPRND
jgi:photosystem II stability/assembly factor-like uncharacterized protein